MLALLASGAGCGRGPNVEARRQTATLAQALRPAYFAASLRRVGGAHFHGTARFAAGFDGPRDAITTTTDVWVDRAGNYRVLETNDRDGGREVVLSDRELSVALRYGKMIRRVAEEPEPSQLLEEALGAPAAAWDVVQAFATVQHVGPQSLGGARATEYRVTRAAARTDDLSTRPPATGLAAWRAAAAVSDLAGRVLVDDAAGALMQIDLTARFTTKRDGRTVEGAIEVHGGLSEVASTPPVARPPAEELAIRQRLVPEQRELLGGLPTVRPPPPTPKPSSPKTRKAP
jgi:hypothetical protein